MTITELDLTIGTGAQNITVATGGNVNIPQGVSYVQIVNNSSSASVTYSLNTPATNGNGVTIAAAGSSTISCPPGVIFPLASLNFIGSAAGKATVFYS